MSVIVDPRDRKKEEKGLDEELIGNVTTRSDLSTEDLISLCNHYRTKLGGYAIEDICKGLPQWNKVDLAEDQVEGYKADLVVKVSAPGKVIIHGEHSVVYGKKALAAALGLRTKLRLMEYKRANQVSLNLELPSVGLAHVYNIKQVQEELLQKPMHPKPATFSWDKPELIDHQFLLERVSCFVKANSGSFALEVPQELALISFFYLFVGILGSVNLTLNSLDVKLVTQLKVNAGTGSSASFAVCVAAAFVQFIKIKIGNCENISKNGYKESKLICQKGFSKRELELISAWALNAEKIIHGSASGIDNTVCTYGSMVEFRKNHPVKLLNIKSKLRILLINTNVPRNTKVQVEKVAKLHKKLTMVCNEVMNAIEKCTEEAIGIIKELNSSKDFKKDFKRLEQLADYNHNLLVSFGVSHKRLEDVRLICLYGELHGKLTGAGGGGYYFCYIPPEYSETALGSIRDELEKEGFSTSVCDLGGNGVSLD